MKLEKSRKKISFHAKIFKVEGKTYLIEEELPISLPRLSNHFSLYSNHSK